MTQTSIFYIHESVFELAGKELSNPSKEKPAFRFLTQCVVVNVKFKKKLNGYISYSPAQVIEFVKSEDYSCNFKGFTAIGENMVCPITEVFDRNRTANLVKAANSKNVDVTSEVKIVVHGYESLKKIEKLLTDHEYPLKIIKVEDALEEILKIHDTLNSPKVERSTLRP